MKVLSITDPKFRKYGKVVTNVDFSELVEAMQNTPLPENVVYLPSVAELEALPVFEELKVATYGELPIQIGYCNGNNYMLNAVEYHRSSEINVAATDAVLMLGSQQDITDEFTYDTSLMEAFLLPKGTAVELYGTTLHYAPCNAEETGFRVAVVLPKDTNLALDASHEKGEDKLITAKNKWLIAHEEGGCDAGSHIGLIGTNLDLRK